MPFSRYYATEDTPVNSGVLTHTVANPSNANFGYLDPYHLEVYASKSDQTMAQFQADVSAGTADQYTLNNDFTLESGVITINNLAVDKRYRLFIKRATPKLTHFVDFQAGSPLTEADLDNSNKYSLFREQEIEDDLADTNALIGTSGSGSSSLDTAEAIKTALGIEGDAVGTHNVQEIFTKTIDGGVYAGGY